MPRTIPSTARAAPRAAVPLPASLAASALNGRADTPDFGALVAGGYHIETHAGVYVDLTNPEPADIRLGDVAHGLAHICRGSGQTGRFFSVAEHAVIVSGRLRELGCPPQVVLAGLHHDDSEAYLGDVTRPLKKLLPAYRALESRMWEAIRVGLALGECDIDAPAVKDADRWALGAENYHLRRSRGRTWFCAGVYSPDTHPLTLGAPPAHAKALWLAEHDRVQSELAAAAARRVSRAAS
jgi:5'-nucleotidase